MIVNDKILQQFYVNIDDLKPKVIDSMVAVYGEKHRSLIEERLDTIYINTYITYEDIYNYYNHKLSHARDMFCIDFLKDIGIDVSFETEDMVYKRGDYYFTTEQKDILKSYLGFCSFSDTSPIYAFNDNELEDLTPYVRNRILKDRCKILENFGLSISPENYDEVISTEEGQKSLSEVKKIYDVAVSYKSKLEEFANSMKDIKDYIDECASLKADLHFKYVKQFFTELLPHLNDEEQNSINKALNSHTGYASEFIYIADPNNKYYSSSSDSINPELDDDLSIVVSALRINCQLQEEREFFTSTGNYQSCLDNLNSLDLYCENDFTMSFIKQKTTCVSPNITKDANNNFQNLNIVHLPILAMLDEYRDVLVIHELAHVVELSIDQVSDKDFHIKTGLDTIDLATLETPSIEESIEDDYVHKIRPNELLSENIHHQLAILITNHLHDNGIYLFDDSKTSKTKGSSSYEHLNSVTVPFINEFYNDLVDAMIEPDETPLINKIGNENLDTLNSYVTRYHELPYYKMMNDVINNRDTELVQTRNNLIDSAKNVVQKMRENSKLYEATYTIPTQLIGKLTVNQSTQSKSNAQKIINLDKKRLLEGEHTINE